MVGAGRGWRCGGGDGVTSVLFALASAASSAVNLLTQRVSSRAGPSGSWWRLAGYLLRQPLWLFGVAAAVAAFLFQAAALHRGQLSVVQPLLVTELVFVLVLRRLWLRQPVRPAAWGSAALTCVGLAVFLTVAEPHGGSSTPTPSAWPLTLVVFGGASVVLALLAARGSPVRRAALYAGAAAVTAALAATFIKTVTQTLVVDGPAVTLTSWPVYALLVSGVANVLLDQAALHVGPLTISQPVMVAVTPIVSIWLSVWLFAQSFTDDGRVLAAGACAFAALIVGVVLLARTAPHEDATPARSATAGERAGGQLAGKP